MRNLDVSTAYIGSTEIAEARLGSQLVLAPNGNELWYAANEIPALDQRFADDKSLIDTISGQQLITHTRASAGTYRGSDGLIKTATTNLLLWSEEFDQASWSKSGAPAATVTANDITAPNGTLTADKINTSVSVAGVYQDVAVTSGIPVTLSGYIKAGSNINEVLFRDDSDAGRHIVVRLSDGAIVATAGLVTSSSSTFVGDGWYRISMTYTPTTAYARWWVRNNTSNSGDFYLWGAQLEQSSTVGEYIPTTSTINSAPRFDHNPVTGESLGLLVEEQRTNLLLQSEDFSTTWGNVGTIDPNAVVAPDGTLTADTITTATNAVKGQTSQSFAAGSTLTVSVFAKKNVTNFLRIEIANSVNCWYNLDTGAVGINSAGSGNVLFSAKSIQPYPNGWYRCILTLTTSTITTASVIIFATTNDGQGLSGGESIHIWGAQLEAGSFPTSYIPTTSSTVTRAADVVTDTSTGANIRTLYAEFRSPGLGTQPIASLDDDTANERIELLTSGTDPKLLVTDGGSAVADIDAGTVTANTLAKLAARFATDDYAAAVDGGTLQTDTSGTLPTVDRIRIGSNQAGDYFTGTIARIAGWDEELPDTAVEGITQ